jgi:hypothetical protein
MSFSPTLRLLDKKFRFLENPKISNERSDFEKLKLVLSHETDEIENSQIEITNQTSEE